MHTKRHPHLLAAPIAILSLVSIVVVNAALPGSQSTALLLRDSEQIETLLTQETVDLASGQVILLPNSSVRIFGEKDELSLESGELLVSISDATVFYVDSLKVRGLRGSAYFRRDGTSSTVVALSGLFAVEDGGTLLLAPLGYQVQKNEGKEAFRSPVPGEWLRDFASKAPKAKKNDTESSNETVSTDSVMSALAILDQKEVDDRSKEYWNEALASVLHDLTLPLPALVRAHSRQVSVGLLDAWFDRAKRDAAIDPEGVALLVHHSMADIPSLLEPLYPKQAELWREKLSALTEMLIVLVSADQKAELENDLRAMAGRPPVPESSSSETSHGATEAIEYSDEELAFIAEGLLLKYSALLASTTTIRRDEGNPNAVRIENVFFAEEGRDVEYDFTYSPSAKFVSRIVRDGVPLPNAVEESNFFTN